MPVPHTNCVLIEYSTIRTVDSWDAARKTPFVGKRDWGRAISPQKIGFAGTDLNSTCGEMGLFVRRRKNYPRPGRIQSGRAGSGAAKLLTGIAIMLIVAVFVDARIRPVVENMIAYQTKVYAFRLINTAMMEELDDSGVEYADIAHLTRRQDGLVASVETNIVAVNRLKSRVAATVARQVEEKDNQTLHIPIGTLLGSQLTSGRGPSIEVKVVPVGFARSELSNEFLSAGINQTLHQITLNTTVEMMAILPGFTVKTETSSSYCIAETLIVGTVPEGFTLINGDDSSVISKLNDYQAGG